MIEPTRDHPPEAPSHPEALTLRPRVAPDDARIVALYRRQEADSAPLTVARYRAEHAARSADRPAEVWVALEANRLVGAGGFRHAWWTGQPGIYALELRVASHRWRRGIGTRLFGQLRARLGALEATRLLSWVRADAADARRFAARQGFAETGQIIEEYRLSVPRANTAAYAGLEERLQRAGLRFASLAEMDLDHAGAPFLRALHELWAEAGGAGYPALPDEALASWCGEVLQAPGLSPQTHWVALDGARPVGMTFLKRLSARAAENDYTGVAATHRGRGIAPALKLRAIAWARAQGVDWFYTSSEIGNTPMLSINRRLGYQPGVRRVEVARDLP